jgi:hypothetical protein
MRTRSLSRRQLLQLLAAFGIAAPAAPVLAEGAVAPTTPAGSKLLFENEKMRVIEHASKQRLGVCGTGYHSHPPHLTICLTDVKARVTLPDKQPFIAENKAGDLFWDPGGFHTVENLGSRDAKVYLVELKS